jgi:protein-tyrosine phosphatase
MGSVPDFADLPGASVPALTSFPGFANARDLGGLPRLGGGITVHGALVRAETPRRVHAGALGWAGQLVRVVDLRSAGEAEAVRHPLAGHAGYRLRPMIDPRAEASRPARDGLAPDLTLGEVYQRSVSRNSAAIAAIMAEVADAPPGPVMVACAAGKDRTGMIVAILLQHAGVTKEAICADYHQSELRLRDYFDAELAAAPDQAARTTLRARQNAAPENIRQMLEHIDAAYGSAAGYLRAIGLADGQASKLRDRLVADEQSG